MTDAERMQRFEQRQRGAQVPPQALSRRDEINLEMGEIFRRRSLSQSLPTDGARFDALDLELSSGKPAPVAEPAKQPATDGFVASVRRALEKVSALREADNAEIARAFKEIHEHVAALETRMSQLERRPVMRHVGTTWEQSRQYTEQEVVTMDGSCWLCRVSATQARPGTSSDWVLIVKRGKDAK